MEKKNLTKNTIGRNLLMTILIVFVLSGIVSADECVGQDCGTNMSIYVESPTCQQVLITYTGVQGTSVNLGYDSMKTSFISMVANFFALAPSIGTISAVIILVVVLFFLVGYVLKVKSNSENFNG